MRKKRAAALLIAVVMLLLGLPLGIVSAEQSSTPELFFGNSKFNGLTIKKNVYRNASAEKTLRDEAAAFYKINEIGSDEYKMLISYATVDEASMAGEVGNAVYTRKANTGSDGEQSYYCVYLASTNEPTENRQLEERFIYTLKPLSKKNFSLYHYDNEGNWVSDGTYVINDAKEVTCTEIVKTAYDALNDENKHKCDSTDDYFEKFKILFPYTELVTSVQFNVESGERASVVYMCDGDTVEVENLRPGYYFAAEDTNVLAEYNRTKTKRTGEYDTMNITQTVTNSDTTIAKSRLTTTNALTYDFKNYFDRLPTTLTVQKIVDYFGSDTNPMSDDVFHFRIKINDEVPTDLTYKVYESDGTVAVDTTQLRSSDFTLKAGQKIEFDGNMPKNASVDLWEMLTDSNGDLYYPQYSPLTDSDYQYVEFTENGKTLKAVHRSVETNVKSYAFTNIPNALVVKKEVDDHETTDPNKDTAQFTYKITSYLTDTDYNVLSNKTDYVAYKNAPVYQKTIDVTEWTKLTDKSECVDHTANKYIFLGYPTYELTDYNKWEQDIQDQYTAEYVMTMTAKSYDSLTDTEKAKYYVLDNNGTIEYVTLDNTGLTEGQYTTRYRVHLDSTDYQGLDESLLYPYKTNRYTRTITEAQYKALADVDGWTTVTTNYYQRNLTAAELLAVKVYIYQANGSTATKTSSQTDEFVLKNGERCVITGLPYGGRYVVTETKATDENGADITSNYVITSPTMPLTVRSQSTAQTSSLALDQKVFNNFYQPKTSLIVSKNVIDNDNRANPDAVYLFRLVDKDGNAMGNQEYTIKSGTTLNDKETDTDVYKTDGNGYFTLKPLSFGQPVTAEFNLRAGTYKVIEVNPNETVKNSYLNDVTETLRKQFEDKNIPIQSTTLRNTKTDFYKTDVEYGSSAMSPASNTSERETEKGIQITPTSTNNHAAFTNTVTPMKYKFEIEKLLYKDDTFGRPDANQRFVFKVERFAPDDTDMKTVLETFYVNMGANTKIDNPGADYRIVFTDVTYADGKTEIQYGDSQTYKYDTTIYRGLQTVSVQKKGWYRISEVTDWSYTDYEYVPGTNKYSGGKSGADKYSDHKKDDNNMQYVVFSISDVYDTDTELPRASFSNVESIYAYKSGSAYAENTIRVRSNTANSAENEEGD